MSAASNSVTLNQLMNRNSALKAELIKLNQKLNHFLEDAKQNHKKPNFSVQQTNEAELANLQRQVEQSEQSLDRKLKDKLEKRIKLLSDPMYEIQLVKEIQENQQKVVQMEVGIKNKTVQQKRRGEKLAISWQFDIEQDFYPSIIKETNEMNFFSMKVKKIEQKFPKIEKAQEEARKRFDDLNYEFQQLQQESFAFQENYQQNSLKERLKEKEKYRQKIQSELHNIFSKGSRRISELQKQAATLKKEQKHLENSQLEKSNEIVKLRKQEEELGLLSKMKQQRSSMLRKRHNRHMRNSSAMINLISN